MVVYAQRSDGVPVACDWRYVEVGGRSAGEGVRLLLVLTGTWLAVTRSSESIAAGRRDAEAGAGPAPENHGVGQKYRVPPRCEPGSPPGRIALLDDIPLTITKEVVMFRSTLKRGFSPTPVAVAGLVLALAVLGPSAAVAKQGGTDRPVKGTTSGTVTGTLGSPLGITIDLSGVATHLGKYSVHIDAVGVISGGEVVVDGTFTVVAANGDQLTGTATFTAPLPSWPKSIRPRLS